MLTYLKIDNLALIRHAEIEFGAGFNVVTGETGAGKSVLLGAVSLLLGGRGDKSVIRSGASRCEICGIFLLPESLQTELNAVLEEAGVPPCENGELQLRRVITESSGRCHVNDVPVTVHFLHEVGARLIDVHAANEHQSLVSQQVQLALLDRYAGTADLRNQCADWCARMKKLMAEQTEFERTMPGAAEAANYGMMLEEIRRTDPKPGEDEELAAKHALASHARQIKEDTATLTNMLADGEDAVTERLAEAYRILQDLAKLDAGEGARLLEQCGLLSENVRELAGAIASFGDTVELDAEAFAALEARIGDLFSLKRRYGPTLEQVLAAAGEAEKKLDDYRRGDEKRAAFRKQAEQLKSGLAAEAAALSAKRKNAAEKFAEAVGAKLASLGFASGKLVPEWETVEPGANGQDRFEWLFAPNPGEPPRPLRKIASSGELSRVMLALKTVLADADQVPVSIFDEIDVNIGGETAVRVGEELHKLGRHRQILSISHLAQVAVRADRHFIVSKHIHDGHAETRVELLDRKARVSEIARMLGGGEAAAAHAARLLKDLPEHE